nr:hypothetical protein [Tanacetum cinerariifolium]
ARKQVMEATERLGGQYSPHLHPRCTHLVVQSSGGRKFEHALKHGATNGLLIVTLGCVRRNGKSLLLSSTGGKMGGLSNISQNSYKK